MNYDTFKDRLKVVVGGESNTAFAKKCELAEGTIRRYLRGDAFPPLDTLSVIADVSGCSLAWLASGEGEMKRGAERGSMEYILDAERRAEVDQGIKQFGCYPLDQGLLKRSIEGAVEWFKAEGIEPTPQQLSEVVIQRYSLIATIKFGALQQGGE